MGTPNRETVGQRGAVARPQPLWSYRRLVMTTKPINVTEALVKPNSANAGRNTTAAVADCALLPRRCDPAIGFRELSREGWQDVVDGNTHSVDDLWQRLDA